MSMSTMSLSRINRPATTSAQIQSAVTSLRHRSEAGSFTRTEYQPKNFHQRRSGYKSKRNSYRSQLQQQHEAENFVPLEMAPRLAKWSGQIPAEATYEDKVQSAGGDLSIDEELLELFEEQVYEFNDGVNQLYGMKNDLKWTTYRNIYLVMVMFILCIIISGQHPPPMLVLIAKILGEEYGTEYYYGSVIFNVFRDMGTVISSRLLEPELNLNAHSEL